MAKESRPLRRERDWVDLPVSEKTTLARAVRKRWWMYDSLSMETPFWKAVIVFGKFVPHATMSAEASTPAVAARNVNAVVTGKWQRKRGGSDRERRRRRKYDRLELWGSGGGYARTRRPRKLAR